MSAPRFLMHIRITLEHVRPAVWRRIVIAAESSFWDLHVAIQDSMGWEDSHLHAFYVREPGSRSMRRIGIPDDEGFEGSELEAGWEIPLVEILREAGDRVPYEYDFGDGWVHEVVLEKITPRIRGAKVPQCLAGEGACPPEDCGGPPGYERMLEALADPAHEEHDTIIEWLGGTYDPAIFDPAAVRFDNPRQRFRKAFGSPTG